MGKTLASIFMVSPRNKCPFYVYFHVEITGYLYITDAFAFYRGFSAQVVPNFDAIASQGEDDPNKSSKSRSTTGSRLPSPTSRDQHRG
jgi:hypothetical protein